MLEGSKGKEVKRRRGEKLNGRGGGRGVPGAGEGSDKRRGGGRG